MSQTYKYSGPAFTDKNSWVLMEYLADTPSGDPMHYAYEEAGAIWNAVTGFWEMNGLNDLTNDNLRAAYSRKSSTLPKSFKNSKARTNFSTLNVYLQESLRHDYGALFWESDLEIIAIERVQMTNTSAMFYGCVSLRSIIGEINMAKVSSANIMFDYCKKLEAVNIVNLGVNLGLKDSPLLKPDSVASIIQKASTATFTITLHADAYARAMADPAVQSALSAKPNVSLASV